MYNPATDANSDLLPQAVWMRDLNANPMDFFPFKVVREQQRSAIMKAVDAYAQGKKIVVIEGPCGSGKSGIIMTLANYFGTAHILTPLKVLQSQYVSDFPNVAESKGKSNYQCAVDLERIAQQQEIEGMKTYPKTCGNGPCTKKGFIKPDSCTLGVEVSNNDIVSFDSKTTVNAKTGSVMKFSGCPYQVAKAIAGQTPIIVHNFDSFLYQNMNPNGKFEPRPFLAVDECHNFEKKITDFNGISISEELMLPGDRLIEVDSLQEFFKFFCVEKPYSYQDLMKYCDNDNSLFLKKEELSYPPSNYTRARFFYAAYNYWNSQDDNKRANEFNDVAEKIIRIGNSYQNSIATGFSLDYAFELQDRNGKFILTGNPLFAGTFSHSIIKSGQFILLASATILNHEIFCRSLGIKPEDTEFIEMESDFPKENRIIKKEYAGAMSYANKSATMPKMIEKVAEILRRHGNEKGLIHSHTFDITRGLFDGLIDEFGNRILTMDMFKDKHKFNAKEAMIAYHNSCPDPTIIIDPACDQGVDLPDDLCRFQCIVKVPYPSMNKWMKARMALPGGQEWYLLQAALKFVQSYGRGNRHKDDHCVHYLLDSDFDKFLNQCKSKNVIPSWILAAVERKIYQVPGSQ